MSIDQLVPEERAALDSLLRRHPKSANFVCVGGRVIGVEITRANLGQFPHEVFAFPALINLNLSRNQLESLPEEIGNLTELAVLNVSKNNITSLPDGFENLTRLTGLYLSENQLDSLPSGLGSLRSLIELIIARNQLSSLPDGIGNLTALATLNVFQNKLVALPDGLGSLTRLSELYLSRNQLESLPIGIGNLVQLSKLILTCNRLSSLPDGIANLAQLTELYVSENQLRSLPDGLKNLPRLTKLDVSGNQLGSLPDGLKNLTALIELDVSQNQLVSLPDGLGNLTHLTKLNTSRNLFASLPDELGRLTNLTELHASDNRLTSLPDGLGNLTHLTELYIPRNQLASLPDGLGNLIHLTELNASDNHLGALPDGLGNLTDLTRLFVSGNQLTSLPDRFGDLSALAYLSVANNQLGSLPPGFGNLPELAELSLLPNPLPEYFPELLDAVERDVLRYIRDVQADGVAQYAAKLVLVGNGNCGKSQLRHALLGRFDQVVQKTTPGVEIEREDLVLPNPGGKGDITLHTWDFGGQETYEVTHQFFYSRGAVYLLVWHPRQFPPETGIENWLRKLRLRLGDEARVLIVATHKLTDERPVDLDLAGLQQKFPGMILGLFAVDSLRGDNTTNGIPELKAAIANIAAGLPNMGRKISQRWAAVRDELAELGRSRACISRAEYDSIAQKHRLTPQAADTWLRRLHDLGYVLYYADDIGLKDHVVLTPDWITQAIARVLDDEQILNSGGRLEHARFAEIWAYRNRANEPRFDDPRLHPFFHRMMEQFDICIREKGEDWSLVGEKVPHQLTAALPAAPPTAARIRMAYKFDEEPLGLMPWLIVRTYRFTTGRHWRQGVYLEQPPEGPGDTRNTARIEFNRGTATLSLDAFGPAPDYFFHLLRDGIEVVLARWPGLKGKTHKLIPCPQEPDGQPCKGTFPLKTLDKARAKARPTWPCPECLEETDVARLLTGFGYNRDPLFEQIRELVEARFDQLAQKLDGIGEIVSQIKHLQRTTLRAISTEHDRCPRLFTLWPKEPKDESWWKRFDPRKMGQDPFELWLWCDHAEQPHPVKQYDVRFASDWLLKIAPYANLIAGVVRMGLPLFGAGLSLYLDQLGVSAGDKKEIKERVESMQKLAEKSLSGEMETGTKRESLNTGLTAAEGAALREFHTLLQSLDKSSNWGDLRRVLTPEGDIHWVCGKHLPIYDPGTVKPPAVQAS